MVDVVIIGAGTAGLAAARTLAGTSLQTVVLEVKNRIGGCAHTEMLRPGLPFDRGFHWLHSSGLNPYTAIADALGYFVRRGRRSVRSQRIFQMNCTTPAETRAWQRFEIRSSRAVDAIGERGHDIPVSDVVNSNSRWAPLGRRVLFAGEAVSREFYSTAHGSHVSGVTAAWCAMENLGLSRASVRSSELGR